MEVFECTSGSDMQGREFLLLDRNRVVNIIENMADGVVVLSPDLTIWYANRALRAMTGWTARELDGAPFGKIIADDEISLFSMIQQMMTMGPIRDYETCLVNKESEKIPVSFNGSILKDGDGRMLGLVGIARDHREIKKLILKLEEANATLEKKVMQRTAELEKAYNELKSKELQLIQNEKMASIGRLAAGVAHEINNPIGFINSNLNTLEKYVESFVGLAGVYSDVSDQLERLRSEEVKAALNAIKGYMNDNDMDYVAEDAVKVIRECGEGAERIRRIVQGLKVFSHVDRSGKTYFDINKGLDSTLNMVRNEIKYKAEVVKEYGDIPEMPGYPQELNQVFMNLLVNASHAIEAKNKGLIKIKTYQDNGSVFVEISDNGCGIPDDIKNRIFEPFFTTKEVGKGTGLGLSISYGIIKNHNGEISVESRVGEGTTFTVRIPVKQ
jgi:PAS domain S-box-containing protein